MYTSLALVEGVIVMLSIILLAAFLKRLGILQKEHSHLFSGLVIKVTLPALIFSSLALSSFHREFLMMALVMVAVEIVAILLALLAAKALKLERGATGALMLASAFGMTSMLGYPLISQVFPHDPQALEEAVVTSELGVGLLLFILGPLIAMFYGDSGVVRKDIFRSVAGFFISPVFVALVLGIGLSFFSINPEGMAFSIIDRVMVLVGNANTLLVALVVGLVIEVHSIRHYWLFMAVAVLLKLIIKPIVAYLLLKQPAFTDMMQQIVFIETTLPSAMLGAVFARHYNCRPDLVSMAVMVTLVMSVLTVSLLFWLLF
jgi:hypothetical protein